MASPSDPPSEAFLDRALAHLDAGGARLGRGRLLCVDGPSGAGKSTFAARVSRRRSASLVIVDDLLDGWTGGIAPAVERLVQDVLTPLADGRAASYRRYDWHRGHFGPPVTVPPGDLLVLEGVGAGARAIAGFSTTLVWLEAPTAVRRRRALARDGDSYAPHWDHWAALEESHFAVEGTSARADLRWPAHESGGKQDGRR